MSVKQSILKSVKEIERDNEANTRKYKSRLKEQIRVNLLEKKQSVESNQGIIDRYYNAKPLPLTQMQQAMKEAAQ